jgi:epoxide hydrolase-like predicted phosphatase
MKYLLLCLLLATTLFAEIKAVVFDYGDVVGKVDRERVISYLTSSLQITREEAIALARKWKHAKFTEGCDEAVFFKEAIGPKMTPQWLAKFDQEIDASITQNSQVVDLVKCLQKKGYATPLFSNVKESGAIFLRQKNAYALFKPIVLSCEIGAEKPDPKAYQIMLEKVRLPASEMVFIDDKAENVEAAKAAGIDAIQYTTYEQLVADLAKRGIAC